MPPITRQSRRQARRIDPLARPDNAVDFECTACLDTVHETPTLIHGNALCEHCVVGGIVPQFYAALKDETQYPVRWAMHEVDITRLARFFSKKFLAEWVVKAEEYSTPIPDRMYCNSGTCSKFLGLKSRHRATKACSDCGGRACADCGGVITESKHECQKDQASPFDGLQRGRDYQICPECTTKVELGAGCNHMTCKMCRLEFCYICAEPAMGDSGHWAVGKPCPKYNFVGDNPLFDENNPLLDEDNILFERDNILFEQDNFIFERDIPLFEAPPDDFMNRLAVVAHIMETLRVADLEGFAPANAPREVRLRNQDRQRLRAVGQAVITGNVPAPDGLAPLVGALAASAALAVGIGLYTLHLEPDVNIRLQLYRQLDAVHNLTAEWMTQAGVRVEQRFPVLSEIWRAYLAARTSVGEDFDDVLGPGNW